MPLPIKPLLEVTKIPPPPFLYPGFIRDQCLTLWSAKAGTNKSMLMLAMALSMQYQIPLFGTRQPTRQLKPFIFAGDSADWDIGQQTLKLARGYGLTQDQMEMLAVDGIFRPGPKIVHKDVLNEIYKYHKESHFDVLFLDSLRKSHGLEENSGTDMAMVMDIISSIRYDLGVSVVIIHHQPKPQAGVEYSGNEKARGSTVITDSVDYHYCISRKDDTITLEQDKVRGMDGPDGRIRLQRTQTQDLYKFDEIGGTVDEDLLEAIAAGANTREAMAAAIQPTVLNLTSSQVYNLVSNALQDLRRRGLVHSPRRGVWECLPSSVSLS